MYGTHIAHIQHQSSINYLYLHEPSLTCYFVENAPASISENINTPRGLTNGTQVTLHSLVLEDREDKLRISNDMIYLPLGTDVELHFAPKYINVRIPDADVSEFVNLTLLPGDVVIPITFIRSGSQHKNYTPEEANKIPFSSRSHNVDLQFAKTMHKVQAQTCERITVDLNLRPFIPKVNFHGFFVTFTRVRDHRHWARMPDQPGTVGLSHLTTLHPPGDLISWLNSYDTNGNWNKSKLAFPITAAKEGTFRRNKRPVAFEQSTNAVPVKKKR